MTASDPFQQRLDSYSLCGLVATRLYIVNGQLLMCFHDATPYETELQMYYGTSMQ